MELLTFRWLSALPTGAQLRQDAPKQSQTLPSTDVPKRSRAFPGAPKRTQTFPCAPKRPQALADAPQAPSGAPKRPQTPQSLPDDPSTPKRLCGAFLSQATKTHVSTHTSLVPLSSPWGGGEPQASMAREIQTGLNSGGPVCRREERRGGQKA